MVYPLAEACKKAITDSRGHSSAGGVSPPGRWELSPCPAGKHYCCKALGRGQKATDYLETMVRYIISAREDISYKEIHGAVKNVSPKGGEMLMTIAEKLRNEGKKEGLEKGMEMTLSALQAFREGKDLEEVMNLTGLERDILLKIQVQAFK